MFVSTPIDNMFSNLRTVGCFRRTCFLSTRSFSSRADLPYRIVGAAILQKNPEIVWDHEPWQAKYDAFTVRKNNRNARKPPPLIEDQPDHDPMQVEEGKFEPGCKISEFDLVDDITSPYRCLAENLFFIVRKNRDEYDWEFPQTTWREGETIRETVERALPEVYGLDIKSWIFGNAPIGHYTYEHEPGHPHYDEFQGTKVFMMHAAILTPKAPVLLDNKTVLDFAWTTKEELMQRYLEVIKLSLSIHIH